MKLFLKFLLLRVIAAGVTFDKMTCNMNSLVKITVQDSDTSKAWFGGELLTCPSGNDPEIIETWNENKLELSFNPYNCLSVTTNGTNPEDFNIQNTLILYHQQTVGTKNITTERHAINFSCSFPNQMTLEKDLGPIEPQDFCTEDAEFTLGFTVTRTDNTYTPQISFPELIVGDKVYHRIDTSVLPQSNTEFTLSGLTIATTSCQDNDDTCRWNFFNSNIIFDTENPCTIAALDFDVILGEKAIGFEFRTFQFRGMGSEQNFKLLLDISVCYEHQENSICKQVKETCDPDNIDNLPAVNYEEPASRNVTCVTNTTTTTTQDATVMIAGPVQAFAGNELDDQVPLFEQYYLQVDIKRTGNQTSDFYRNILKIGDEEFQRWPLISFHEGSGNFDLWVGSYCALGGVYHMEVQVAQWDVGTSRTLRMEVTKEWSSEEDTFMHRMTLFFDGSEVDSKLITYCYQNGNQAGVTHASIWAGPDSEILTTAHVELSNIFYDEITV